MQQAEAALFDIWTFADRRDKDHVYFRDWSDVERFARTMLETALEKLKEAPPKRAVIDAKKKLQIIQLIDENPGLTQEQIASTVGVSRSAITHDKELITVLRRRRRQAKNDNRRNILTNEEL